jgi:hypothetical protein
LKNINRGIDTVLFPVLSDAAPPILLKIIPNGTKVLFQQIHLKKYQGRVNKQRNRTSLLLWHFLHWYTS